MHSSWVIAFYLNYMFTIKIDVYFLVQFEKSTNNLSLNFEFTLAIFLLSSFPFFYYFLLFVLLTKQ